MSLQHVNIVHIRLPISTVKLATDRCDSTSSFSPQNHEPNNNTIIGKMTDVVSYLENRFEIESEAIPEGEFSARCASHQT